ncbi:MAG: TIGR03749 family integrating conjugative element protein [Candidatus Thiodiazotropha endolucinida]|nr:TIGR03749 family integrating conjugative element protein [Candidatus Thiodiazotropha endolucinida]
MRKIRLFKLINERWLALALLLIQSWVHADSAIPDRIEWKKVPIQLTLVVGQEQRIEFPAAVKVGVPAAIQTRLRSQSVNGTLYLLAHAPFVSSRLMVKELDSGRIYLFDVSASKEGRVGPPMQIYISKSSDAEQAGDKSDDAMDRSQLGYIPLTRFAAQQLYAPSRLVKDHHGIVRVPVSREPVELVHGGAIEATPLVAWRSGGLYVTAVKLTNRTHRSQTLDPRNLRGAWLTATFQHHRLLPQGDEADTTAVYLISARPFNVSL